MHVIYLCSHQSKKFSTQERQLNNYYSDISIHILNASDYPLVIFNK